MSIAALVGLAIAFVWWCDHRVRHSAQGLTFNTVADVPYNKVALVLGTANRIGTGEPNPYFEHRIEAAAALYHAGKVEHLLLSGDNGTWGYNEPADMRAALIAAGVDSTRITLDYAGFRTFDSVVRAQKVFGQKRFTVVSQRFHNERAIHIGRRLGVDVVGLNAKEVVGRLAVRTKWREKAARVNLIYEEIFGAEPHFLGEPVTIGEQPAP